MKKTLAAIAELRQYDHAFISKEGAIALAKPFGLDPYTYTLKADPPGTFKGLTLANGQSEAHGIDAQDLAMQICRHLKVDYPAQFGRGSQLRSCCDALEQWARAQ